MKLFLIFFSIILFASCGDNKSTNSKQPPDTAQVLIGYNNMQGELKFDIAFRLRKDTVDWVDIDSTKKEKAPKRGRYYYVNISIPDSTFDTTLRKNIKPILDSIGRPKFKQLTLIVPDSLVLTETEEDIRELKKKHNLK